MRFALLVLACLVLPAQTRDPATGPLSKAYQLLQERKYLEAIDQFLAAVQAEPHRASIRKDLGYAYLKAGETEAARDVFEDALTLDATDHRVALELAFLCHETGREARALEIFDALRQSQDPEVRKTAGEAFGRVDAALRQAIERWEAAVEQDPANRAARLELGRNLEKHREPARAVEHYLAAWHLPPRRDETLLDLARARHEAGDREGAAGAWLLAARSADARIAERARDRLPQRHPYANEYLRALDLDLSHTELRRDLAFLWLAVGAVDKAVAELETVLRQNPQDEAAAKQLGLLRAGKNEKTGKRSSLPHKELGEKSLAKSYLKDALREFQIAHEIDPGDHEVAYKLGVVLNLLRHDREAIRYFRLAAESPDTKLAADAERACKNLETQFRKVETSLWMFPMFSTRYHDAFHYAQLKTEFKLGRIPLRPYLSLRVVGDWKRRTAGPLPQFLSESSLIAGAGLRTRTWQGLMLWGEAGQAISYLKDRPRGVPRLGPDYRGGLSWFRNAGATLGAEAPGLFAEFSADSVFLSRFQNNVITYWQMRPGYRLPVRVQVFWNGNVTFDRRRESYANFAEFGPGFRFRVPPAIDVTVSLLRGMYLISAPKPNYYDLRIGLWYAVVH